MNFDFKNAQLSELLPLKNSVAQGHFEIENQCRSLFLALFNYHKTALTFDSTEITFDSLITFDFQWRSDEKSLAEQVFDTNVLGNERWIGYFDEIKLYNSTNS